MTSAERINEYTKLEKEKLNEGNIKAPKDWPQYGEIVFENVSFAYDETLPSVLKNVSFKINANEKIGVVGRTGAGKSTIFQTLFRMAESEGTVCIDGVNINDLSLHELRSKISIIPVG
jgi:ATP-binding cassette subfamily C (CFTR/MRP) protein 4